jgi:TolB-like protein
MPKAKRQLAAIMFTDIVGYTSLLEKDEKKAFEILKKNHRIHRRLIKKFNGRLLKEMGGGILASFNSNIDAVMCAVFIQKATQEVEIPIRIGIHLGDVIFEKKDVLGDGVNIASRIQGTTERNEIIISERVYHDLKNKEGLEVEFLGEQALKGVTHPLGIYKVSCKDESLLDYGIDTGELIRPLDFGRTTIIVGIMVIALLAYALYYFLPKTGSTSEFKKGVLILPFDNYTSDTLEYYTAGMHNALITDIGKISALKVISKTTARAYKNLDKSIPEIASELGVNAIIEGEVLCLGDSVCLQIKMINADDEEEPHWVQDFYVEKSQILSLYHNIAKELSDRININLTSEEESRLSESRTVDPEAYAAYLKGQQYWEQLGEESIRKAMEYFQIAIDKEPDWAPPYAGMALAWSVLGGMGFTPETVVLPKQYNYLNKALELDPNSATAHYANAITATWREWDWEKGEREFLRTLDLNPNDALCRIYYAHLLMILKRFKDAKYHADLAIKTDPLSLVLGLYGRVMQFLGEADSMIEHAEDALSVDPENQFALGVLTDAYLATGDTLNWYEIWRTQLWWMDDKVLSSLDSAFHEEGYVGVIKARIKTNEEVLSNGGSISFFGQAHRYLEVKNYDKAMDYYDKAYDIHYWELAYISIDHLKYPELKDNPRYIALLKKMNLPVD